MQKVDISKVPSRVLVAELTARGASSASHGIACAIEGAGHEWLAKIMPEFRHWLARRRTWFAIEDFRLFVENHHPELCPKTNKAWGCIPRLAKQDGLITAHGFRHAISPKTRAHVVRLYARA